MYIWIACDVSRQLGFIRGKCIEFNSSIGLSEIAFSLPQHISLKISFEVEDDILNEVTDRVSQYLSEQGAFYVYGARPEVFGSILWLSFDENETLLRLHKELDDILLSEYGVPYHELDKCFKFHSTLFIDDRAELLAMYDKVCAIPIDSPVEVNSFVIGTSKSGKAGEYSVVKNISTKSK